jgi:N-acetylglucosaminyldiphosphoundecaprenol N-acetyl-beta-D-mannosaminyltransferase
MSLDAVKILGINITKSSKKEILEFLQKSLNRDTKNSKKATQIAPKVISVVTPNPEQIVYARSYPRFAELLNQADVALPDGVGIVLAQRILGQTTSAKSSKLVVSVIPGIEFMEDLVSWASKRSVPIALIGSRGELAIKTLDCLSEKYPGLRGWAIHGPEIVVRGEAVEMPSTEGYFAPLARRIAESNAQVIFVGLGAPKQEYFMEKLRQELSFRQSSRNPSRIPGQARDDRTIVLMAVGGSFDEISGRVPRAPQWVSRVGLKWLWRLILEPWRIVRQLALLKFVQMVVSEKLQKRG